MHRLWFLWARGKIVPQTRIPKEMQIGIEGNFAIPGPHSRFFFCLENPTDLTLPRPITTAFITVASTSIAVVSTIAPCSAAMVNYPLNPVTFLLPGFAIEPGPTDRLVRSGMVVGPIAPLNHDFLAISEASHYVPLHRRVTIRNQIAALLHES